VSIIMARPTDFDYKGARDKATERHNRELRLHSGFPQSFGSGLGIKCACGQAFNLDGWRDHLYKVCIDVPVPR
jgi:hypothetical protein